MADEVLKRDQNRVTVLAGVTDDADRDIVMLRVDPVSKKLLVKATGGGGGSLTVEDVDGTPSVANVNTIKFPNGSVTDDGGGEVTISISGSGDVTAASNFGNDNRLIRSDGTSKGVQASAITLDDSGNLSSVGTLNTHTIPGGTGTIALTSDIPTALSQLSNDTGFLSGSGSANEVVFFDPTGTSLISGANIYLNGSDIEFVDNNNAIVNKGDPTKRVKFESGSVTTATTRTLTIPDKNGTLAMVDNETFTTRINVPDVRATNSGGLLIEASNGTDIGLLGVGNTANVTWYGTHNFDTLTASKVAVIGASKSLASDTGSDLTVSSGAISIASTAISDKTLKSSLAGTEEVLINDAGTLKKTTTQDIADLGGSGSSTGLAGINDQSGTSYTLVLGDAGYAIRTSSASAVTVTIPANSSVAFPVGTQIMLIQGGAGQLRVAITSDTLQSYGNAYNLVGQYGTAFLTKVASTTWVLDGNLTTLSL